jgi:serine/threonine-protein kinase
VSDEARFCSNCGRTITGDNQNETYDTDAVETRRVAAVKGRTAALLNRLIGRVLDSKYEIVARLGAGGMGAVYRAKRLHIGDEVAIKVINPEYVAEPEAMERFRREARAAALLHHPNVVTIHDYSESSDEDFPAYIVMELVTGGSLRDLMGCEGRLAYGRAVALMRDICAGVGAAHKHGIVHRDLKPDNILIVPPHDITERETVKVVDFGIAKLRDLTPSGNITRVGEVIGTPYYMSPEQCKGAHLDARSDVYSLGAIMYELIAGVHPFYSQSAVAVVAKHLMEPVPPMPAQLGIPPALQMVINRALAKSVDSRPADAPSFARELQAAVDMRGTGRLALSNNGQQTRRQKKVDRGISGRQASQPWSKGARAALIILLILLMVGAVVAAFIIIGNNKESVRGISSGNSNSRNQRGGQTNTRDTNKNTNVPPIVQPDVSGKWVCFYGIVQLFQVGPSVSGNITYTDGSGYGTIKGTLKGRTLEFEWVDNSEHGIGRKGQLDVSSDSQTMKGYLRTPTGDVLPLDLQRIS